MALIKLIVLPIVSYRDNGCMVQPLSVEAPGISVPIARIVYPMARQEAVRRTVFGVLDRLRAWMRGYGQST
ncbi:hypothetical protein [Marinilabilia salmonicolor]|uniref:hypothetical protein n=1 Tax=Marinilabilia salmonicolor TaxID=989 RepID=UPI0011E001DB|nr:hypothetical protein [Marinilabilia salmonicolor]